MAGNYSGGYGGDAWAGYTNPSMPSDLSGWYAVNPADASTGDAAVSVVSQVTGLPIDTIYNYAKSQFDPSVPTPVGRTMAQGTTENTGLSAGKSSGSSGSSASGGSGGGSSEDKLTEMQTKLIEQQVKQLEKQNKLIDDLWPSIEDYYESSLKYTQQQTKAAGELLPIQKATAEESLKLTQMQTKAAQALLPLQEELAQQGIDLNSLQIEAIKSQTERNEALQPLLLEAMGYQKSESGEYVPIENQPTDPILQQFEDRLTAALEGDEPISPALEKELSKEQEKLETDLSRRLGPNWRSTTPGIQAIEEFNQRAGLIREEARQQAIGQAGSQYMTARGLMAGEQQQKVANLMAMMGSTSGISNVPTGITTGGGGSNVSLPTGVGADITGLMGGGASSAYGNIADLRNYYADQRARTEALRMGQSAGRTSALMGGLMGGAQIGSSVGGTKGSIVGGGLGLLAGYLLS